jgi:mannose-6-phosphate isomerase-like protein (cupin superfamily)
VVAAESKFRVISAANRFFIPLEAIHRIENPGNKPVKIIEAQVGSILKESDIVRFQDVYGRIK